MLAQLVPRPNLRQPRKVACLQPQRLARLLQQGRVGQLLRRPTCHAAVQVARAQLLVDLVPLNLKGGDTWNQVINIAHAGDERSQRSLPLLEVEQSPPRPRPHRPPFLHPIALAVEHILHLSQNHQLGQRHHVGQAQRRIDQRRHVEFITLRLLMQAGVHGRVRLLQATHTHRPAAAQKRIIGADVQFNFFAVGNWNRAIHAGFPSSASGQTWLPRATAMHSK